MIYILSLNKNQKSPMKQLNTSQLHKKSINKHAADKREAGRGKSLSVSRDQIGGSIESTDGGEQARGKTNHKLSRCVNNEQIQPPVGALESENPMDSASDKEEGLVVSEKAQAKAEPEVDSSESKQMQV